jgi:hypothetical protein
MKMQRSKHAALFHVFPSPFRRLRRYENWKRHKPLLSIEREKWRKRIRINNEEWVIYDFQCFYSLLSLKSLIHSSFRENKCRSSLQALSHYYESLSTPQNHRGNVKMVKMS